MTPEEFEKLAGAAGPKVAKRRARAAASASETTVEAKAVEKDKDTAESGKKRTVPLADEAEFNRVLRPYRPLAGMLAAAYNKALQALDPSPEGALDANERPLVETGIAAGLYEYVDEMSGVMLCLTALACTATPRIMAFAQRKREEKEAQNAPLRMPQVTK